MYVDLDYLCVIVGVGELLFLLQGGNMFYLDYIVGVLCGIYEGSVFVIGMFMMFDDCGFIQLVMFDVQVVLYYWVSVSGLYGVDCECLVVLDSLCLVVLNCVGYLEGVYLMFVLLYNMCCLIVEKQCCFCVQDGIVQVVRN